MDGPDPTALGVLAATMGADARVYHVGFVVPDLDEAIATLEPALGVHFTEPMELAGLSVENRNGPAEVALRLVYSARPVHVELIESAPGSLWDFDDRARGHHLGVWADDVAAEADRLDALGLRRTWWAAGADGRTVFSYHETPYGFFIELVDSVAKAFYPGWFRAADPSLGDEHETGAQRGWQRG